MAEGDVVWPWGMTDRDPDPASRPWVFNPRGFLLVVVEDDEEAVRANQALFDAGFAEGQRRTYSAAQLLEDRERFVAQQGLARRIVETVTIDTDAVELLLAYARDGRAFVWVVAPRKEDANRAIRALSSHQALFFRYYGDRGVEDVHIR